MGTACVLLRPMWTRRLDLKQHLRACQVALIKTHYYGGIKKYQWLVAYGLHGVVVLADGRIVPVAWVKRRRAGVDGP